VGIGPLNLPQRMLGCIGDDGSELMPKPVITVE